MPYYGYVRIRYAGGTGMDKNDTLTPQEKKDKNRSIVVITLLIAAVLLIADLYVMINMSTSYLALVVITVLLLVCVYFFINAIAMIRRMPNI